MGPSSESSQDWSGAMARPASRRVLVLGGSHQSRCQEQSRHLPRRGCWPYVTGLLIQTACTPPAEGLHLEQRGRAQDGAAVRQLSESNLRGFPRD